MNIKKWATLYITIPIILISIIFSFNFIIDPYSITSYNLLNIPNKFARDDRKEKVSKLYNEPPYVNMLFGSSRVYGINPLIVKKYIGGKSYNAGVGSARVEDILGFLLYLKHINKLPKNIVVGLDFYSFNQNVETNKYFLLNDDINFLSLQATNDLYFSKFLSIDALRASFSTLKNFLKNSQGKPRFDIHGTAGGGSKNFIFFPKKILKRAFDMQEIERGYNDVKTISYNIISPDRMQYMREIITLCKEHHIKYKIFITPINGQLLTKIKDDSHLYNTFINFKSELAHITPYYDFTLHNNINDNSFYFMDPFHTQLFTGNLVLARLFNDNKVSLPNNFGMFVAKKEVQP